MLHEEILAIAEEIAPTLIEHRRKLHSIAEVGFDLSETAAYVKDIIGDYSFGIKRVGKCGFTASVGSGIGKTVLLRADMDALKMREETGLSYAAHNGNMHSCGHDIHTSMLLGALEIISRYSDKIQGRIIFAFQGGEEILEGAKDMISNGLLDDGVDMAMMIHVICGTDLPTGFTVVSSPGVSAPSSDFFRIMFTGEGAHGATPDLGKDALAAAARVLLSIEELPSREFSYRTPVSVSVGMMNGGTAPNAIADSAEIRGTFRAYSKEAAARIKDRISELSDGLAQLYGCTAEMQITSSCPALENDPYCSECVHRYATELLGSRRCCFSSELGGGGGSEDFAYIAERVPSIMVAMSAGSCEEGYPFPLHSPRTVFNEKVISEGAALMAYSALKFIECKG